MTITLTKIAVPAAGYRVNGPLTIDTSNGPTQGTYTGTSTADLTLSGGPIATLTWNVSISGTGAEGDLNIAGGTVTCDGMALDAKWL